MSSAEVKETVEVYTNPPLVPIPFMRYSTKCLDRKFRNPKTFCSAVDCWRYGQKDSKFGVGGTPDPFVQYNVVPNSPTSLHFILSVFLQKRTLESLDMKRMGGEKRDVFIKCGLYQMWFVT